ncbi:hypothetical protein [Amycolatopsis speibonae]|uniref:Holin n=1 Tax=Amycolatopsis speibonae TaxID=1450224 RepID=A0ABV7PB03_9PSEU
MSLALLIPGVSAGWWALAVAVTMTAFAAAIARSIITAARRGTGKWSSLTLVLVLLVIAGFEVRAGVELVRHSDVTDGLQTLCYLMVANLGVGIARAWQLMNMRSIGLLSSLFSLAHADKGAEEETHSPRK